MLASLGLSQGNSEHSGCGVTLDMEFSDKGRGALRQRRTDIGRCRCRLSRTAQQVHKERNEDQGNSDDQDHNNNGQEGLPLVFMIVIVEPSCRDTTYDIRHTEHDTRHRDVHREGSGATGRVSESEAVG